MEGSWSFFCDFGLLAFDHIYLSNLGIWLVLASRPITPDAQNVSRTFTDTDQAHICSQINILNLENVD